MNNYEQHQFKIREMKLALTYAFADSIRIFDRHVGLFYTVRNVPVKINKKGMCDNWAILTCFVPCIQIVVPIHLEIETKTGSGALSKTQKEWRDFCRTIGVWHFVNKNNEILIDEIRATLIKHSLRSHENDFHSKPQK